MSNISMHSMAGTGDPDQLDDPQNQRHTTYAATLDRLSKTPQQPELYSRVQYHALTRYLFSSPIYGKRALLDDPIHVQWREGQSSDTFIHVVVHHFSDGKQLRRDDFDLKDGLSRFVDHSQPEAHSDQIVFVRGSLSPAWIEALGTKCKIDPELFRRHLRYLPGQDYSDLPSLPSANTEIMTLILPSLYTRSDAIAPGHIGKFREKDLAITKGNHDLITSVGACGGTVIRRCSTLNEQLVSVEHEISIFRRRMDGSQIVVVLLDNGLEMNHNTFHIRQWMLLENPSTGISPIPVIVPRPPTINIDFVYPGFPMHDGPVPRNSIGYVASLLPFYLGASANPPSTTVPPPTAAPTAPDVFALIPEVFRLVAGSECQFLNQLRRLVQDQELDAVDKERMSLATNTLRYIKLLLEDHKQSLNQNIAFLESRCSADRNVRSPSLAGSSTQTQRTSSPDELTSIVIDFKELLARSESLSAFCTETVDLILNGAMLRESQKAIQMADDQRRLTIMASLFLPASVIFSLFGMNVTELGTGSQGIWLPFVVVAPVATVSWMLAFPDIVRRFVFWILGFFDEIRVLYLVVLILFIEYVRLAKRRMGYLIE